MYNADVCYPESIYCYFRAQIIIQYVILLALSLWFIFGMRGSDETVENLKLVLGTGKFGLVMTIHWVNLGQCRSIYRY